MRATISFVMKLACLFIAAFLSSCSYKTDIPLDYPTPAPPASATPLPKMEFKRDAELEMQFAEIAKAAKGKVGAAAVVLETGDAAILNADDHYPMQSVYKLPIAMAMMEQIRLDRHALDEQIGVTKDDFVRQGQASPLRDKNPNGGIFTIRELLRLALVESDGTASDVLLRVLGGPIEVQRYLAQIGIADMKIVNTEKELGQDWDTQYKNWATPLAATELLRYFNATTNQDIGGHSSTSNSGTLPNGRVSARTDSPSDANVDQSEDEDNVLFRFLKSVVTGPNRIKGLLPKGTIVAHKTGTGGTKDGITGATNDIGIVNLPNGNHLAVAVFVSDSPADERTREAVIARVAEAAWDRWSI
jgi:beta-lactamase class A